jgi:hypothetical protein
VGVEPIPLARRKLDWALIGFFAVNLFFITYIVDLEQLVIADPAHFDYPLWPPRPLVDLVHWWGRNFDPLLMARPPWWRMTIWIDQLAFGPFYVAAIYALVKGKGWIQKPALMWAGLMVANVSIIMFEEFLGPHQTPQPLVVTMANLPWFCFPFVVAWRLWRDQPFAERAP